MLLVIGVETTAGTGSVENLEEYLKSSFAMSFSELSDAKVLSNLIPHISKNTNICDSQMD